MRKCESPKYSLQLVYQQADLKVAMPKAGLRISHTIKNKWSEKFPALTNLQLHVGLLTTEWCAGHPRSTLAMSPWHVSWNGINRFLRRASKPCESGQRLLYANASISSIVASATGLQAHGINWVSGSKLWTGDEEALLHPINLCGIFGVAFPPEWRRNKGIRNQRTDGFGLCQVSSLRFKANISVSFRPR